MGLELTGKQKEFAYNLLNIIKELSIGAKSIQRQKSNVVYLKESGAIVTLLTIMGAHSTILKIENIQFRKKVYRKVNWEPGNLTKTMSASVQQLENISNIDLQLCLDILSESLKQTPKARQRYSQATLAELADIIGIASKSGVNNKVRKLNSIAQDLKNDKGVNL